MVKYNIRILLCGVCVYKAHLKKQRSGFMLSIMMPCYKEAENLKFILPEINRMLSDMDTEAEILVVDTTQQMDETKEVCENAKKSGVCCRYVQRRGGNTYGDAIRTGIEEAKGEYLIIMDADGSHSPADIKRLYDSITKDPCGIVIGSRYVKGGSTDNNFILIFMSNTLNVFYRITFGLKVKDVSDSFRIYDLPLLKKLNFFCDNFDIVEEILIKFNDAYPDKKIREIPIKFNKRQYGDSKRDLVKFIFSYLSTIRRLKKLRKAERNIKK